MLILLLQCWMMKHAPARRDVQALLRRYHSSWAAPGGSLLLGGKDSRFSSEIVSGAGGDSEPGFPVHYT